MDWERYTLKDGMGFNFFIPTYNYVRLILQEPSNQSPQPGPSSLPEPPSFRTKTSTDVGDVPSVSSTDVNSTSTGCRSTTNPAVEPYKPDPGKTTRPPGKSKGTIDSRTCTRPTHPLFWKTSRKAQFPPPITSRSPTTSSYLK